MPADSATCRHTYDCIIIGGGHAGCEAAMACSSLGLQTLLLTSNTDHLGELSCNPAVGGLAKGHIVREIDAMGGMMGLWADESAIHFRMLNAGKGPAVRAPRAQVDRVLYMNAVKRDLFAQPGLHIIQDMAISLLARGGKVRGVATLLGREFAAGAICLSAGTFLRGMLHVGEQRFAGGRMGDAPADSLSVSLIAAGVPMRRFMTCTPPRLLASSIDRSSMQEQAGDATQRGFSFYGPGRVQPQRSCCITWTNKETHNIIRSALGRSPIYSGAIPGPGPRYCPSIEDKVARFPDKERHQIFVEPEGLHSGEYYVNGMATGLPADVQQAALATVPGLENAQISRPGYAIEYDCIDSTSLTPLLESKTISGLWFAGQVNGSSGYEEAAAQGIWAAVAMYGAVKKQPLAMPGRNESYISVLVDDLVTRGTDEPYRMFTSRAEHRLLLRESNADLRLTPFGRSLGLINDAAWARFSQKKASLASLLTELRARRITPDAANREYFIRMDEAAPNKAMTLADLLRRPTMNVRKLSDFWPEISAFQEEIVTEAETILLYEGYLERQHSMAERDKNLEAATLSPDLAYQDIAGLTREAVEKLTKIKPATIGQAGRIPGITPAALLCINIHLKKLRRAGTET